VGFQWNSWGRSFFFWVDKLDVTPAGWWLLLTPLKNDGLSNSWDDDIPNLMGKIIQMFQTTNQPVI